MPLEISEIGVHIAVGSSPVAAPPARAGGHPGSAGTGGDTLTPARQEAIVEACVQAVLRQLRAQEQR